MFENQFDQAIEEVSATHDLNWDDDSKVRLFARFLAESTGCYALIFERFERFLGRQADEELTGDEPEEEDPGKCFPVEWDRDYTGGNYSSAGNLAFIPFKLLDGKGDEGEQVARAFEQHAGVNPIHIVNYNFDEQQYNVEGEDWEDE